MVLYLCVLIVFSLHRESLKLILAMNPSPRSFCHSGGASSRHGGALLARGVLGPAGPGSSPIGAGDEVGDEAEPVWGSSELGWLQRGGTMVVKSGGRELQDA
jgi:hypothetical protein